MFQDPGTSFHDPRKMNQDPGTLFQDPGRMFLDPGLLFEVSAALFQDPGTLFQVPLICSNLGYPGNHQKRDVSIGEFCSEL